MRVLAMACAALPATACSSAPALAERPALITITTADSRADLLSAVSAALNYVPLLLADDALTQDSVLLIEPRQRLDPSDLPINGRELGRPERFLLSIQGRHCVLTHERTQQRQILKHTSCNARD
jgi:hypothetical protein